MMKKQPSNTRKLKERREEIDRIDSQILKKLQKRSELAQKIGRLKREAGQNLHRPSREREVLQRLKEQSRESGEMLEDKDIEAIYREIMSACLAKEMNLKVAYLGPAGTFSEEAARKKFGAAANYRPKENIEGIFKALIGGEAEYGLVPLRNSKAGAVSATLNAFINHGMRDIRMHGSVILQIRLHLAANCKTTLTNINRVLAHPVAQTQCADNLAALLPAGTTYKSMESNAAAAIKLKGSKRSKNLAALIPHGDLESGGMHVLREDMQDEANSATHFLILGGKKMPQSQEDLPTRTPRRHLMVAAIRDEVGALMKLLRCFESRNINLHNLDILRRGALYFLIEFETAGKENNADDLERLVRELESESKQLIYLGHCPAEEFH